MKTVLLICMLLPFTLAATPGTGLHYELVYIYAAFILLMLAIIGGDKLIHFIIHRIRDYHKPLESSVDDHVPAE